MEYDGTLVLEFPARTHETPLLTDREKHRIGLAVTMTRGCQVCTRRTGFGLTRLRFGLVS